MDAEVKQRTDKANIYNESPAQGRIPAVFAWPHRARVGVWESVAMKKDIERPLPRMHWGNLAEHYKAKQSLNYVPVSLPKLTSLSEGQSLSKALYFKL